MTAALDFPANTARQQIAYYREEAARLRALAETESLPALRRHLMALAREHQEAADELQSQGSPARSTL